MMQDVHSFLSALYRKGVNVWVENAQLRFRAPKGRLLPEEMNLLRTRKVEIIRLLEDMAVTVDVPLDPRPIDSNVPLTAWQRWLWSSTEQGKKSKRTCIDAVHAFGSLNTCLLQRSIEAIVQRHESLRTRIVLVDGAPVQKIDKTCEDYFKIVDIQAACFSSVEKEAQRVAEMFLLEEIDLSVGPLFAAMLLKLSTCEFVLILALDHIVADAASMGILNREVWTLYLQAVQGHSYSLPPLSVQFADYAILATKDVWRMAETT